ncbi:MAG TPA: FAD-binding oxidoreductase [Acidimicrobiia bacterium]|nr:FAD-binding oxidoreductase [Acidimicrobiia bacterium]
MSTTMPSVVVIGGGIAGVAAGYYLARAGCQVTLVEKESVLAYHSTGRSAALFFEDYGARAIRPLTRASRSFFDNPPPGLADVGFLERRGAMWIGRADQQGSLERELVEAGPNAQNLSPAAAIALVPVLSPDLAWAIYVPDALDLDVAAIHQAFVRGMRREGANILVSSPAMGLTRHQSSWLTTTPGATYVSDVVVDAAGAWGDEVAALAGVEPVGLDPRRRTAFMVPGDIAYAHWPLVADVDNLFYFRPDGTQILCSLADETPMPPGDAQPEPLDIALAIERINAATTLGIETVRSAWAGLRTFVADRAMVIGFDRQQPGFFWLVGQGGTGIQTAPAAGELTAALVTGRAPPPIQVDAGLVLDALSPDRLRGSGSD